jgi:hypothetical protein
MNRQNCLLIILIFLCLGTLKMVTAQCTPNCSINDSCIVVIKPVSGDTIVEKDLLPIEFATGIDLVTARISIDSGKSWKNLLINAITVTPCTTRISSIYAPLLDDVGVRESTAVQACKIRIAAYGSSHPSGISNGYFFIKRQNSSVLFSNRKLKSVFSDNTGNKMYNLLGQKVDIKPAKHSGIFLFVNKTGKVVALKIFIY